MSIIMVYAGSSKLFCSDKSNTYELERNTFSAKEDGLDWIANRTYLAKWIRAWLLKPDYSDLILALSLTELVIWRRFF